MFVIVLTYVKPPGEVERLLHDDNACLDRNYQAAPFIAPRVGTRAPAG